MYTHSRGILPIQIVTLYCRGKLAIIDRSHLTLNYSRPGCNTTYRPNYYVSNAESTSAVRQYYAGVPEYIEVTQHSYVDVELSRLFRHQMAFAQ